MYNWLCKKELGWDTPKLIFHRGGGIHPPPWEPRKKYAVGNRVKLLESGSIGSLILVMFTCPNPLVAATELAIFFPPLMHWLWWVFVQVTVGSRHLIHILALAASSSLLWNEAVTKLGHPTGDRPRWFLKCRRGVLWLLSFLNRLHPQMEVCLSRSLSCPDSWHTTSSLQASQ